MSATKNYEEEYSNWRLPGSLVRPLGLCIRATPGGPGFPEREQHNTVTELFLSTSRQVGFSWLV